jgi:YHS domain-containing protein
MVEKDPQLSADYKGQTYYFCSKTDRDKFKKNPQKYEK